MSILLSDDDKTINNLNKTILQAAGFRVFTDDPAVLKEIRLVITNNIKSVAHVQKDNPSVKILFTRGDLIESTADCLAKPYSAKELVERVTLLLS